MLLGYKLRNCIYEIRLVFMYPILLGYLGISQSLKIFKTSLEVLPAQFWAGRRVLILLMAGRLRVLNLAKHAYCWAMWWQHTIQDKLFRLRKFFLSTGPETRRRRSVCSCAVPRSIILVVNIIINAPTRISEKIEAQSTCTRSSLARSLARSLELLLGV